MICVKWFRYQYPRLATLLFAVPNGGRRDATTGRIMKAEGVVPGVADLLLLIPSGEYHGLCIEMKTEKGRQQDTQKLWQKRVEEQGYLYKIVRSFEEFKNLIEGYVK